jgi:hypothetical protein
MVAEAGLHQLRRAGRADRHHAPGTGGEAALDLRAALPARAELLHGAARPEAQQLAIYIGWMLHRTWGGIVAGALFVLPSLFILAALTYVYLAYGDVTFVQGVFNGIKPAVVAIVGFAAWRIGTRALKNKVLWGFAAASFIAIFVFRVPFP